MTRMCAVWVVAMLAPWAAGVSPQVWQQTTEAEFAEGEFDATAVSSLGEVTLAPRVRVLLEAQKAPAVVSAVAVAGADIYAASGSDNTIYRIGPDQSITSFPCEGATIVTCLLWTGQDLLAGSSGSGAGVYRVDAQGQTQPMWTDKDVASVWALARGPEGLYAATGAKAAIYHLASDGAAKLVHKVDAELATNILCLAVGPDGLLYAGSDKSGLVLQIDPATGRSRVILAAQENEVSAVIPDLVGGLYVATSDTAKAAPEGDNERKTAALGRPDAMTQASQPDSPGDEGDEGAPTPLDQLTTDAGDDADTATPARDAGGSPGRAADEAKGAREDYPVRQAPAHQAVDETQATKNDQLPDSTEDLEEIQAAADPGARISPLPSQIAAVAMNGDEGEGGMEAALRRLTQMRSASRPSGPRPSRGGAGTEGNAVYYIQPDGMVNTLFRREVTVLSMLRRDDWLLLGTGNGGVIYSINVDTREIFQLADTAAGQVTALAPTGDNQVVFATANSGSVCVLGQSAGPAGTFVSAAHDAEQIARWGTIRVGALGGGRVGVSTRTGNTPKPADDIWGPWSPSQEVAAGLMPIASPPGRFLQYRLELEGGAGQPPVVQHVEVIYQVANLAPTIEQVRVEPSVQKRREGPDQTGPKPFRQIRIQATDPNEDEMTYSLSLRAMGGGQWITLDEKLEGGEYVWDTRTIADGEYDLRAQVSDSPSNPPTTALTASMVQSFVTVDNTSPVFNELLVDVQGKDVRVSAAVSDATSRLAALAYSVDSQEDWVTLEPVDHILDSPRERVEFTVKDLKPGPHRIAIRAVDLLGNPGYGTAAVTIEP